MRITALPSGTATNTDQIAVDNSTDGTRKLGLETYVDGKIDAKVDVDSLTEATAVDDTDVYRIKRSTNWLKITWDTIKTAIGTMISNAVGDAVTENKPIHISESVTSLSSAHVISNASITANHRVVGLQFVGANTTFKVNWTTASGSVTFTLASGTFSSCTFDFILELTQ